MKLLFSLLLVATTALVFADEVSSTEDPKPFYQDEYSGKTIESMDMAADLVIRRFYNAPRFGTKAPGFSLPDLETGESVFLQDLHKERPVVLLFSSYGCDVMRDSYGQFLEVYEKFKNDFAFVMIYVREAHALDGLHPELAKVDDPKSNLERQNAAHLFRKEMKVPFRVLVDPVDDRTATRWGAWPIRLFVVDPGGTVVYSGKPGPWGYHPGRGFAAELSDELRKHEDRFSQESLEEFLGNYKETTE